NATPIIVNQAAALDLYGVDQVVPTLSDGALGGGQVANSGGAGNDTPATLYVGGTSKTDASSNLSSTFSGSISGVAFNTNVAISLTKVGAGTFTLSGSNNYRGVTNINSGTLRIGQTTGSV